MTRTVWRIIQAGGGPESDHENGPRNLQCGIAVNSKAILDFFTRRSITACVGSFPIVALAPPNLPMRQTSARNWSFDKLGFTPGDHARSSLNLPTLVAAVWLAVPFLASAQLPAIIQQPASQTIFYGDPVTFTVSATSATPLSYQWYRDGKPISSATANAYTLSAVSSNDDTAGFSVRVANSAGAVTSLVATVTVDFGVLGPPQTTHL